MRAFLITLFFIILSCTSFAKDMSQGTLQYNFALYAVATLDTVPTQCDEYAINDPNIEWMCAYYPQGYEAFIAAWEQLASSDIVQANYAITPISEWVYFNETDNSVDFYGKAYNFGNTVLIAAYDPSEQGREIFIGVSPLITSMLADADGTVNIALPSTNASSTALIGSFNCVDFATQAEAQDFFVAGGFSADYDPYNLDADNNGIACESVGETVSNSEQCPLGEYWVDPYVRSDGVQVKGHCRKKR